jgi:benzoyl-CoA reductase/2-hydroxyglutaryl-CoA dehydratase subunit BcrC/BadD/HgdB
MSLTPNPEAVRVLAEKLAREHAATGKVVGYVTPCVPAELIDAAGMLPLMLSAGGETSTDLGDRYMEELFDGHVRAVFERLLDGEFDFLSAIVIPRANDSAHRLYYYLCELQRSGEAELPPLLLADVSLTPDKASRDYSIKALARLWDQLREIGDPGSDDKDIKAAIARSNRRTELLEEFIERRRAFPGGMTGAEALAGFAAARMLPGEVFEDQIGAVLRRGARSKDGAPVIVCGTAQEEAGLHELIEALGGVVAGDFHALGELSVGPAINTKKPPIEALVDRDRASLAATRSFADPAEAIVNFAKACEAEAAVFSYTYEEDGLTWDFPAQRAALEAAGVRVVRLKDQARPFDAEANREAVAAVLEGRR